MVKYIQTKLPISFGRHKAALPVDLKKIVLACYEPPIDEFAKNFWRSLGGARVGPGTFYPKRLDNIYCHGFELKIFRSYYQTPSEFNASQDYMTFSFRPDLWVRGSKAKQKRKFKHLRVESPTLESFVQTFRSISKSHICGCGTPILPDALNFDCCTKCMQTLNRKACKVCGFYFGKLENDGIHKFCK